MPLLLHSSGGLKGNGVKNAVEFEGALVAGGMAVGYQVVAAFVLGGVEGGDGAAGFAFFAQVENAQVSLLPFLTDMSPPLISATPITCMILCMT